MKLEWRQFAEFIVRKAEIEAGDGPELDGLERLQFTAGGGSTFFGAWLSL